MHKPDKETFKYVVYDSDTGGVIFKANTLAYFDTKEEIINVLSKININKGPKAYSMGAASLESLKPFLKNDPGRFNIPTVSPDIINNLRDNFRNQEALTQQQAMERQHAMNNPYNPKHGLFSPEFVNSLNNPLFSPSHFQPPQMPQLTNRFSLPVTVPIVPNKETVFNNHPDWKLIKKIGTDESGTKVIMEVEINGAREIKIVDANEVTSKNVGVFFVVIVTMPYGDVICINPSPTALQNMVFKTAYRFDYYDDGVFVISEEIKDVNELLQDMNKELNELIMANMQANQGSTLIR